METQSVHLTHLYISKQSKYSSWCIVCSTEITFIQSLTVLLPSSLLAIQLTFSSTVTPGCRDYIVIVCHGQKERGHKKERTNSRGEGVRLVNHQSNYFVREFNFQLL